MTVAERTPLVEMRDISVAFGGVHAVRDVTIELYVIAAAVVGGTSFAGGIGTIAGAVLGAFVMQSLAYGLSFIGVNSPGQNVVAGLVLIVAVGLDTINRRRGS